MKETAIVQSPLENPPAKEAELPCPDCGRPGLIRLEHQHQETGLDARLLSCSGCGAQWVDLTLQVLEPTVESCLDQCLDCHSKEEDRG